MEEQRIPHIHQIRDWAASKPLRDSSDGQCIAAGRRGATPETEIGPSDSNIDLFLFHQKKSQSMDPMNAQRGSVSA